MESKPLRYFVAVAETGNVTKAAAKLNIAQPALSIAIKKLEAELELSLFHRDERKLALTDEGRVLLPFAKGILQQLNDAKLAMEELKGLEKGEVRLGVPSMMGSYYFPEILMAFKASYPNLKLTIVEAGTQSVRKMLLNGELDIGVVINENVPDVLDVDPIFRSQMVAVVGEHHPLTTKESISYQEFFEQELVMFKKGYFHRDFIDEICESNQLKAKFSFESNLLTMILKIVRQEFAVTALLELVTDNETGIKGIPFSEPVYLDLAMAWRKGGYLSLANRTFIEFVKQNSQG
ncbi:LysR family transcriptional regulator [Vibrio sp. SCSIO 43132]|uniref:LysR family transcriptional regulator n=1 Tax=Vibrio sp. SCSIO 43132 TaxID=2779363 RepID=UPI001CA9F802|nr:LysR family transcriptional regulator [Vibrio sp. SCSIO 43132]UAB71985.1 LysR family transcriptional regulator [Vibrio sp. SCSIO 43132]